jgi:hypothetical protein
MGTAVIDYVRDADGNLRKVRVDPLVLEKSERSDPAPKLSRASVGSYVARLPACIRTVGERIAAEHGITFAAMAGRSRYRTRVRARHRWWAVVKWTLALSYPETGAIFGVDHSSIINAVDHVEDDLEKQYGER